MGSSWRTLMARKAPTVNGAPIQTDPVALKNGDLLELAGIQMQFVQA
jgi:hypothetical protein